MSGVKPEQFEPLAVVSRSGVDESVHFGSVVGLDRDGEIEFSVGDPHVWIYPRSSTKPLQAIAMVRSGLDLSPERLALVCASHNGEDIHQQTALAILESAGLDESALLNIKDHPWYAPAAHEAIRQGTPKSSLQMNCSGKHSGMVVTCAINGWSLDDYLDQSHPLQKAITEVVTELTGGPPLAIGTDGCGAPAHVVELVGLARAMRKIAIGEAGDAGNQVYRAMCRHAHMVAGTGRPTTQIVDAIPGLFAKDGAESVYVAAMDDGRAVALKLSDGSGRGTPTVLLAALSALGVDISGVPDSVREVVLGHGKPVGEVRALGLKDR